MNDIEKLNQIIKQHEDDKNVAEFAGITLTLENYEFLIHQANENEYNKRALINQERASDREIERLKHQIKKLEENPEDSQNVLANSQTEISISKLINKEDFKEIKHKLNDINYVFWNSEDTVEIKREIYDWFYERAQQTECLEQQIYQDPRQKVIESLYDKNKRYRYAMDNILEVMATPYWHEMKEEIVNTLLYTLDSENID